MESRLTRLDYCQFLLSSQVNYTLTHFAEHSRRFSHDLANHYLARERITPRLVWENVCGQVTPSASGCVVFDDTVDMAAQARFAMEFCAIESCGKCTPCRIGSVRGVEVIDRIVANQNRDENLELLEELCDTMVDGSLCAMGGMTPFPVRSAIKYFPEDFTHPPKS